MVIVHMLQHGTREATVCGIKATPTTSDHSKTAKGIAVAPSHPFQSATCQHCKIILNKMRLTRR